MWAAGAGAALISISAFGLWLEDVGVSFSNSQNAFHPQITSVAEDVFVRDSGLDEDHVTFFGGLFDCLEQCSWTANFQVQDLRGHGYGFDGDGYLLHCSRGASGEQAASSWKGEESNTVCGRLPEILDGESDNELVIDSHALNLTGHAQVCASGD